MQYTSTSFTAFFSALFFYAILFFTTAAIGAFPIARIEKSNTFSRLERFVFSAGAGWIVSALVILGAGSFAIGKIALWASLISLAAASLAASRWKVMEGLRSFLREVKRADVALLCLGAITLLPLALPEIGNDALAYHLEHPRQFISNGHIGYLPNTRESLWPGLMQMHFTLSLLTGGVSMAKAVHWGFYALTALAVYAMGIRWAGKDCGQKAAFLWMLTPVAFSQAGYAYVDIALAFFTTLALLPIMIPAEGRKNAHVVLSAIGCAGALSVKYLALGLAGVLFAFWLWESRKNIRLIFIFCGVTTLLSGVWYVRSWIVLGNPVFPFMHSIFGNGVPSDLAEDTGMGVSVLAFVRLLWDATLYPAPFGGDIMGPFLLILIPGLFFIRSIRKVYGFMPVLALSLLYMLFVFVQVRHMRFFLSWIPVMTVFAALVWYQLSRASGLLRRCLMALIGVTAVLHLGILAHRAWPAVKFAREGWDAGDYLRQNERSFEGYEFLENNTREHENVFNAGDRRRFYNSHAKMQFITDFLIKDLRDRGKTLLEYLKENEFEWVWVNHVSRPELISFLEMNDYHMVYAYDFKEGNGYYNYWIYRKQ